MPCSGLTLQRAIRHIANVALNLAVTHFFHDFTQVDSQPLAQHSAASLERLLELLGWTVKTDPKDLKEPAAVFEPLGVRVDLSLRGTATVANTDRRTQSILQEVQRMLEAQSIAAPEVASLVGVCQYMEAQTAGRSGSLAMRKVRRASSSRGQSALQRLKDAVSKLGEHVERTTPRIVNLMADDSPVLIFTDAAAEETGSTFGAVIFDARENIFQYCAGRFTDEQLSRWKKEAGQQIICQAELAALPIAFSTWKKVVEHRNVLLFVDNDPAKDAAVNGISSSDASSRMVHEMRLLCASQGVAPWFDRVPSPSNIADGPSRKDCEVLLAAGASRVAPLEVHELAIHFA